MAHIEINRPVGYAVQAGRMWVVEEYGGYALKEEVTHLYDLDSAYKQAEQTNGDIYSFHGTKLTECDLMEMEHE